MRLPFLPFKRSGDEPWSLRAWARVVVSICAGGAVLTGALAGWYSWQEQKARLDQSMVAATRAMIEATDHELNQAVALVRGLAVAPSLERGDLASFEMRTRTLMEPFGYFLIVSEPGSRRELINTAMPGGATLPELPPEWVQGVEVRGVVVGPIIRRVADGTWTSAVQAVGAGASGTKYVITVGVPAERFQKIVDRQRFPPEWSPVVLDQDWTIVARGINPSKFVGVKGANPHLIKLPSADSTYEGRILEGHRTVNARSRSDKFGWTVAVAVPQSLLFRQFLGPVILASLAGFLVPLIALGAIGLMTLRLTRDVQILAKAAEEMSGQQVVRIGSMHIKELKAVADGMNHASERLKAEEQFRKRSVDELAHRLRNKVATIQAIIYLHLRGHPALRDDISKRLSALSATDDLLIKAHGEGAEIADIVRSELAPYDQARFAVDGPRALLEPNLAFTMALLFHELATNAAKYGALSTAEGTVSIRWSLTGTKLELEWRENGGPVVRAPDRRGFGSQLLVAALGAFGGEVQTRFDPVGLIVHMQIDVATPRLRVVEEATSVAPQDVVV